MLATEPCCFGTSISADLDYQAPRYERPAFLLVGNEQAGFPSDYEVECDLLVKMPMLGKPTASTPPSQPR